MIFIRSYSNNPIRVYYAQLIAFIVVWIGASVFIGPKFGLGYKSGNQRFFIHIQKKKVFVIYSLSNFY